MTNIERNFAVGTGGYLFSLRYVNENYQNEHEHEIKRFLRLWQDPEYLTEFFEEHKHDLRSGFYDNDGFENFIEQSIQDAKAMIKALSEAANDDEPDRLNALFQPLDDRDHERQNYEPLKAKGPVRKSWLRLYALQTREGAIFIVGGAIKLVHSMNERQHLTEELQRLIDVRKELSAYIREGTLGELTIPL